MDSTDWLSPRGDFSHTFGNFQKVGENRINLVYNIASQTYLFTIDTTGALIQSRLVYTNPSRYNINHANLWASPLGGYYLCVHADPGPSPVYGDVMRVVRLNNNFNVVWSVEYKSDRFDFAQPDIHGNVYGLRYARSPIPGRTDTVTRMELMRVNPSGQLAVLKTFQMTKTVDRGGFSNFAYIDSTLFGVGSVSGRWGTTKQGDSYAYAVRVKGLPPVYEPYIEGVGVNAVSQQIETKAAPYSLVPNPTSNYTWVNGLVGRSQPYRLHNAMGQQVMAGVLPVEAPELDVQHLPSGVYVLTIGQQKLRLVRE